MPDLLIRNLDPELKRRLEEQARRDGRSLSEAAKLLLNRGLGESRPGRPIGTALVELFRAAGPIELDIARRELPRIPPDFE
jgi:plasmid stability protein